MKRSGALPSAWRAVGEKERYPYHFPTFTRGCVRIPRPRRSVFCSVARNYDITGKERSLSPAAPRVARHGDYSRGNNSRGSIFPSRGAPRAYIGLIGRIDWLFKPRYTMWHTERRATLYYISTYNPHDYKKSSNYANLATGPRDYITARRA